VLDANGLADASVRITLTRGPLPAGPRPGPATSPTLLVQARPLRPDLDRLASHGLEARRLPWPLRARGLPLQGHKTLAYLPSVLALGAVPEGTEPLLETTEGHLSEGATTNVCWVRGGRLFTPHLDCGCLPGIARGLALCLAGELGIPSEQGCYPAADLADADEAFVTNSVIEVVPVVQLDGKSIGVGTPGPVTRRLQASYRARVPGAPAAP
jgi:branched-subunit amino acid aminotransferase/4-amino-4-deoxychorismate lyase